MLLAQGTEEGADVPARCSGSSIADSARGRSKSGRRARGQHRLEDASPVERSGQLGGVVLHTPYGVKPEALADERRGGWLEHRAEPKHSDPCLPSASHLSRVSRRTPLSVRFMRLHTTLIRFLPSRREDV